MDVLSLYVVRRSVWIVDVLPIQELHPGVLEERVDVFPIQNVQYDRGWRSRRHRWWHRAEDDPYLWLEEMTGEKALAWVKERNADSRKELAETPAASEEAAERGELH